MFFRGTSDTVAAWVVFDKWARVEVSSRPESKQTPTHIGHVPQVNWLNNHATV